MKNFGVENPLSSKKIRKRIEKTNLKRYGAKNPMQNPDIQSKSKKNTYIAE